MNDAGHIDVVPGEQRVSEVRYPEVEVPPTGEGVATEIAPGVLWLRMPLGSGLASINVWALADEGGSWSIVDTGLRSPATVEAWRSATAIALEGKSIGRVFVTHMHPDHSGMMGWLVRRFGARLWMTALEFLTLYMLAQDTTKAAPEEALQFYRSAGMDEQWLDGYNARFGEYGKMLYPLPVQFRAITDGERIRIGDHDWRCVVGRGHSPEHACFYSPALKLFIAGDQVLPTISSNVSVHPYEPDADPLTQWVTTLAQIRETVPDDVLVLPAHGRPFYGLHARIDKLIRGHEEGLVRLLAYLDEPRKAADVFGALFRNVGPDPEIQMMAIGEALAHLACLRTRGLAFNMIDEEGIVRWRRTT